MRIGVGVWGLMVFVALSGCGSDSPAGGGRGGRAGADGGRGDAPTDLETSLQDSSSLEVHADVPAAGDGPGGAPDVPADADEPNDAPVGPSDVRDAADAD